MRLQSVPFWGALAGLVIFQTLFLLSTPQPLMIGVSALLDFGLMGLAFWSSLQTRGDTNVRFERVQNSLQHILDLAKNQQEGWLARVEAMSGIDPEDRELITSLERIFSARSELESHITVSADSVESLIDVIQTMLLLNHGLASDFDDVLAFYQKTVGQLRAYRRDNRLSHFRLHESVTFLGQMGVESSRYSERLVLEVLKTFEEITKFSQGISNEVRGTLGRLMDPSNPEGLSEVRQQSVVIQNEMDHLFRALEQADAMSETSVRENLAQMARVQNIAQAIEDFSESIRMISLNLNIEAARSHGGSGNGKAVQVLATKLSEFATKAQELAAQQQEIVGTAGRVLREAGGEQRRQLSSLMAQIKPLKEQLSPFARIVSETFERFVVVEDTMDRLSSAIESKLQAVIGKFQFQDLVRQEQEHVLALFTYVRDRAGAGSEGLTETQRVETLKDLLETFERMASTENEHRVLESYRNSTPLVRTGKREQLAAGSVELF